MELCSIASGSSGNCIMTGSGNCRLMIDAGISGKRIEQGLNALGYKTSEMQGVLVTHEHIDHIGGLGVIARRYGLPVVHNPCPADGYTKRQEIKELVYELQGRYPGLKARAFGAMQRLPLPEWGPVEHRRRPLPEELEE